MVVAWQTVDLRHVEHGVRLQEGNRVFYVVAVRIGFGPREAVGEDDAGAVLALADVGIQRDASKARRSQAEARHQAASLRVARRGE